MRIRRFNENVKEELKGIDLMNYLNSETGVDHFNIAFYDHIELNVEYGYNGSCDRVVSKHIEDFTIEKIKELINPKSWAKYHSHFNEILAALNDEEAMEVYMDSKEIGLL